MSSTFVQQAAAESQSQNQSFDEKNPANTKTEISANTSEHDPEGEKTEPQNGIKKIQAITTAWTWRALIFTYIL